MLTLALEQSTPEAGIVLLRDGAILASHCWREERKRDQNLFAALPAVLQAAGVDVPALDRFAVGLGPGSFSGVRIAIAAVSALALPGHVPIAGISSAAALARRTMRETHATSVAVIGDARRQRLWMAVYEQPPEAQAPHPVHALALVPVDALRDRLPAGCCVVSPDWDRLRDHLAPLADEGWSVIADTHTPTAEDVGHLAVYLPDAELTSPLNPPEPLYLHPAVFVAPRFPAT